MVTYPVTAAAYARETAYARNTGIGAKVKKIAEHSRASVQAAVKGAMSVLRPLTRFDVRSAMRDGSQREENRLAPASAVLKGSHTSRGRERRPAQSPTAYEKRQSFQSCEKAII